MTDVSMTRWAAPAALTTSRGTGTTNLLNPYPKDVWVDSTTGSAVNINIDLGAIVSIDTVFLGFTNGDAGTTWTVTSGTAGYTGTTWASGVALPAASTRAKPRQHAYIRRASPVSARYVRLAVTKAAAPNFMAGIVLAGLSFAPAKGREWGPGRRIIDTGTRTPLPDGGFAIDAGAIKEGYSWIFGDLTVAEADAIADILFECGNTSPALVAVDWATPAGLNERLHYGLFDRFEAFDRRNPAQTRWEAGFEQWV